MTRLLPTVVHLDADAFFVAVEQALNPALRGRKVAVGGRRRGIIASASYEARAAGVRTPMPVALALRICPDLTLVDETTQRGDYSEFSRRLFDLCEQYTPFVERRSIDEGFLDIGPRGYADAAAAVADMRALQQRIRDEIGISISFGMAATRIVAAIASKQNKPFGFTVVPVGTESGFLAPLPIGTLPGAGPKTEALLRANGITRIGDLPLQRESLLASLLGSNWREWLAHAAGHDTGGNAAASANPLNLESGHDDAKSYSKQTTFSFDTSDFDAVLLVVKGMIDALLPKIRADKKVTRTLTLKVRYANFTEDSAGRSLGEPSDLEESFYPLAETLLRTAWRRRPTPLRLVMVKFSGIEEPSQQPELFKENTATAERRHRLAATVDALNAAAKHAAKNTNTNGANGIAHVSVRRGFHNADNPAIFNP